MTALRRDTGLETPEPIPARDGTVLQMLAGSELKDPRHAVMFKFMTGREPAEDELLGPFERLGEVSARMHDHAKRWTLPPGFTRHTWDYETSLGNRPIWGRWQDGMGMTPAHEAILGRMSEAIRRRLERYGKPRERFGLTHADMVPLSVATGAGLGDLIKRLTVIAHERIGHHQEPALTQVRHRQLLEACRDDLAAFLVGSADEVELRAEDLRRAADALGRITGRVDAEDVLDHIFGRFCIGK